MQGGQFEGGTTEKSFWEKHQCPNGWQCAKLMTDFTSSSSAHRSVIPLRCAPFRLKLDKLNYIISSFERK
jgi:hypothetical protein